MNDKELLELAALAAGYLDDKYMRIRFENGTWNSLIYPDDALRLAVALRIDVTFNEEEVFAFGIGEGESESINVDNPLAATMRAITRAAASMGKNM